MEIALLRVQKPGTRFGDWFGGGALRAGLGIERLDRKVQQRDRGDAEVSGRALYDDADRGDLGAVRAHDLDHFAYRAAGGDDVLDDQHAIARPQRKPTAQRRLAAFLLDEDRKGAEL